MQIVWAMHQGKEIPIAVNRFEFNPKYLAIQPPWKRLACSHEVLFKAMRASTIASSTLPEKRWKSHAGPQR